MLSCTVHFQQRKEEEEENSGIIKIKVLAASLRDPTRGGNSESFCLAKLQASTEQDMSSLKSCLFYLFSFSLNPLYPPHRSPPSRLEHPGKLEEEEEEEEIEGDLSALTHFSSIIRNLHSGSLNWNSWRTLPCNAMQQPTNTHTHAHFCSKLQPHLTDWLFRTF